MVDIFQIENLRKEFLMGDQVVRAVDDVTLTIDEGEFIYLLGPSGCGKSTFLGLLGGLERPTAGDISFQEQPYSQMSEGKLAELRRTQIGFVFQFFNLLPNLTALENVSLPLRLKKETNVLKKAQNLLEMVELSGRAHHKPSELSGGEQQRCAIARALANNPTVILADEPTGNLDSETGETIINLMKKLHTEESKTMVIASHDSRFSSRSDRVVFMKDGKIERIT
jgi:putative ABC transport system ATP-binding protein